MRAYLHILARFMAYWGHLPLEAVATIVFVVPVIVGLLAVSPWVLDLVVSGLVSWWFTGIFREHVWPYVPPEHRRLFVALRDLTLFKTPQPRLKESPKLRACRGPRRLLRMIITILPHARDQMGERRITDRIVRGVLSNPAQEYPGDWGRTVAEGQPLPGRRSVVKVVYNRGLGGELIVVSVMRGRPRR
jgi:hypothetical protein